MKPRNLIIASAVLAALAGAVYWAQKHPSSGSADNTPAPGPKLADISPAQVQSVQITKRDGTTVAVQRQAGKWAVTAPQPFAADQDAVSSMLSAVNPLTADSVVEENITDPSKYGLDKPAIAASLRENSGKNDELKIGNDVPTTSLVYARWGSSPKVYALNSSVKTSLDKTVNDLRDKRLLTLDSGKLTTLSINTPKGQLEFAKKGQDWSMQKPANYRVDTFSVEELVRKLSDAKMDLSTSAEDAAKAKAAFAIGQPIASVKISDGGTTQNLDIRKNKDAYYASSGVVAGVYKVNSDLGQAVDKGVDDFRSKKLFDFGFSDPDKLQFNQTTYVRAGTDWKLNGKTIDSGSIQNFIDKLRDLTATKFVTTGFTASVASVMVQSNGYKRTEQLDFAKTADGYLARRAGDASLYQLDAKTVDDMLNAGKAIKPAAKK